MKKINLFGKLLSVITASAMLLTAAAVLPEAEPVDANAAGAALINIDKEYQTIKGFGGINHPEWTGYDLSSAQIQKTFGNGDDELGFTILRIFVNDDRNQWNKAIPVAKGAQALGATIFASPWNPPSNIRVSGGSNGQYAVNKNNYADYAKHLNDFVKYVEGQGVDLYSISVQNEPDYAHEWTYWSADDCVNFLANYGKKVVEGTNAKMMSPETFQYGKSYYNAILNNPQAFANTDLFGTHFYGTQRSQMDFPALENCGKEIWMTEVYVPNSEANSADRWPEALQVAENIHNGLVVGNMSAYVWWYIRRNYGPMKEDGSISKRGYCMAQYSKYVRPGDVRIDVTEQPNSNVLVSAYRNDDGNVTVVAINKNNGNVDQEFQLAGGEDIAYVDSYVTNSAQNLAKKEITPNGYSFSATLPGQSVTTFVVNVEGAGKSPEEMLDEDGYFYHDRFEGTTNSWSGRGAASVASSTAAHLEGSASLKVSDRTATWNGAYKSLNSRVFVPGNEYSFSANVMYESGPAQQNFQLTLQYSKDGETYYSHIASGTASKGEWIQLANTNYEIPAGATDLQIYVETDEDDAGFIDFYMDEAIGAPAGTVIAGAGPAKNVILGDVNFDGVVNSLDMIAARKGLIKGNLTGSALKAADVDKNGKLEVSDLVNIQSFILGKINSWPEPTVPPQPPEPEFDSKWDDYNETASAQWINFYKDSIYNMGNTYRLSKKLAAAENGESLTIAYLGGSITEGKNYSSPFSDYVKNTFAKGSFKEVNAGMSGTSSVVGLVRSEKDIVSQNPDIIFLEFSVNDHEDIMYKKCFESVIKKFLSLPNEPAVIILINRAQGGFSSQQQMAPVGKNFDIPVISMDNALTKAFNSGFLKASDYFQDEYHPHASGGKLISDCLGYYFRQAMRSENRSTSYTIPTTTVYGTEYETCVNMSANELQNFNAGSFTAGMGYGSLPYSYTNSKNGNTPMTFKTTGKGLIIVFKANSSGMGNINVTVNGKTTKVSGNKLYTWGGPDAELGYYQDTAGELNVSISMENPNSDFTIWGLGVIK